MFMLPRDLYGLCIGRTSKVSTAGAGAVIAGENPDRIVLIIALVPGAADMQILPSFLGATTVAGINLSKTGPSDRYECYHTLAGPLCGSEWVQQSAAASGVTVIEVIMERDPRTIERQFRERARQIPSDATEQGNT
jgi:hypothetical protein